MQLGFEKRPKKIKVGTRTHKFVAGSMITYRKCFIVVPFLSESFGNVAIS